MALVEALGLLQGVQQLQTAQVGRQASGYGSVAKWSLGAAGTTVFVNKATGATLASVARDKQKAAALGSSALPFSSLSEALSTLKKPSTATKWETPRTLVIGPGAYTVGSEVIARPLTLVMDAAATITDALAIEASTSYSHKSTDPIRVGVICPTGVGGNREACLPGGITVEAGDGDETHAVNVYLQGVKEVEVTVGDDVEGSLTLNDAGASLAAPLVEFTLSGEAATVEGATLEAKAVTLRDCVFNPTAVTCLGTNECRLYSTNIVNRDGDWTGGTLLIDPSTNYDWALATAWAKANPGGTAPTIME